MAVGQGVLAATLDVGALDAVMTRLEVSAVDACAAHGRLLRDALELHRVLSAAGAALSSAPELALLRQSSEQAAQALLGEAPLLRDLPGALEALDCGLLTVDQSRVLAQQLGPLSDEVRLAVWTRLQARLLAGVDKRGGPATGTTGDPAAHLGHRGRPSLGGGAAPGCGGGWRRAVPASRRRPR